jgi:hypothetical protein
MLLNHYIDEDIHYVIVINKYIFFLAIKQQFLFLLIVRLYKILIHYAQK